MTDLLSLLDPEYVIPALQHIPDQEFWLRLLDVLDNRDHRIGPATLSEFERLTYQLPDAIANSGDFWQIVGLVSVRGFEPPEQDRECCEDHLRRGYNSIFGDEDNLERLVTDIRRSGAQSPMFLISPTGDWRSDAASCARCRSSRVMVTSPDDGGGAVVAAMAETRRSEIKQASSHSYEPLIRNASVMFPDIIFHEGAWRDVNTLRGDAAENVPKLIAHLSALNDFAPKLWAEESDNWQRQRFMKARGAPCSPESTQTRKSSSKMAERKFIFGDKEVLCEWHTKLRPNVNRVHFAVEGRLIYVGRIIWHLPT